VVSGIFCQITTTNPYISEVFADPTQTWIELFNPTINTYYLIGWYFSDTFHIEGIKNVATFTIQTDLILYPLQYIVITESDWGGYNMKSCSHSIYLLDSGKRPIDNQTMGYSLTGYSYGRYQISGPAIIFDMLSSPSPWLANNPPYIGSLGFTEIMYWPAINEHSYVVIENFVNATQNLFFKGDNNNPPLPKIGYKISGSLSFKFPANSVLGPYRKLMVTDTDPLTFSHSMSVPPWVQVFGPWTGSLNFSTSPRKSRIKLGIPGAVNLLGTGDYYEIESVKPDVYLPWPAGSAATGNSLVRLSLQIFGAEPTNWKTSSSSIIYSPPPNDGWVQPANSVPIKAPKRTSKPSKLALFGPDHFSSDGFNFNYQTPSTHYLLIGIASIVAFVCFALALAYQYYRTMPKSTQSQDKD